MLITIYGKEECPLCEDAKREYNYFGIEYNFIDVSKDKEAFNKLQNSQIRKIPVVEYNDTLYTDIEMPLFILGYKEIF